MNSTALPGIWEKHLTQHKTMVVNENTDTITLTDTRPNASQLTVYYRGGIRLSSVAKAEGIFMRAERKKAARK
jgi:hypothetical protein